MDKMIQLCKIFNVNIDELLNQDIKEVKNNKQVKNNINVFVDSFLDYVTKTVDMFSSMTFKSKVKCLFEQFVLILGVALVSILLWGVLSNIISNIFIFYLIILNGILRGCYIQFI